MICDPTLDAMAGRMRSLGKSVSFSVQPFSLEEGGELWTVSSGCSKEGIGQGGSLQDALKAFATDREKKLARHYYKGWLIEQNWLGQWEATHPDFDASYEGPEDGWVGAPHMSANDTTLGGLYEQIDECIVELGEQVSA